MKHPAPLALLLVLALMQPGCDAPPEDVETTAIACSAHPDSWVAATDVSLDAVQPCRLGSRGSCPSGFVYVSGTGWCRPESAH